MCIHVCVHVCVCVYTYVCVCVHMYVCVCVLDAIVVMNQIRCAPSMYSYICFEYIYIYEHAFELSVLH